MNNTEMKLQVEVLSSLGKIYPDKLMGMNTDEISAFSNEAVSFQLAYKKKTEDKSVSLIYVSVETTFPKEFLFEYRIDYVPVFSRPAESDVICNINSYQHPDLLYKRKLEQLTDRKTALNFIFDYFGEISFKYKAEEKVILDFRTALNNKIEELISNQV